MATNSIKYTSELMPMRPSTPSRDEMLKHLNHSIAIQKRAVTFGKRPFGAILVGPESEVLLTHQSIDVVNHAEASLARLAVTHYSLPFLWKCTLYTVWEPCPMCTSTIYWANIGRIVWAASNDALLELCGPSNPQNLGFHLGSVELLSRGKKDIKCVGPFEELEKDVCKESQPYFS
ncbi:cytidine deaminase-like protein [Guyanagaster necrorhizus]|uniref:Cytidine deaminase-like protein n=1 Tax=Guyanagaster necrorhizus TaxID=856835 RepID=A0A9P7VSW3_9AGAR|nr:cytidine deaminase-like protein [Guyanagaster necrorhizus MCA 3950]KAG7446818.1 cytidine deaminase-like protein [Guyanagaster necrorhizus MCA 3950]